MPITTAGELKRWLADQPEDNPIRFRYVETSGEIHCLAIAEAWPMPTSYQIEFESEEADAKV